ncbi:MAG: type IX secretion system protein PorQ [Tannerellaceae bacterium]|nr:type IX secretion system protein PorQ [Tannerellaceae bacterium]
MTRIIASIFISILLSLQLLAAQTGAETYAFLRYPASARVMALGGYNVSLVEPDVSLAFQNPGLAGPETNRMLSLSYMNFFGAVNYGSALFARAMGEKAAWGAGVSFASYGSFRQISPDNIDEGEFSAGDLGLTVFYSRSLSDKWRGGIALKVLYSSLESYSSIGLAVDAGLSYYDSEREQSFGIAISNAGGQIKSYADRRYALPWDVRAGFSRRMAHAPFRLSLTAMYLNRWDIAFVEHFVAGLDFIPSDNFWLAVGYNPRVARDLRMESGNTFGGFSAGGGIRIKSFDLGVGIARYHPSAMSIMIGISKQL